MLKDSLYQNLKNKHYKYQNNNGIFSGRVSLNIYSTTLCNYNHSLKRKTKLMTKRETIVLEVRHPTGTKNSQIVGKMKKENYICKYIFSFYINGSTKRCTTLTATDIDIYYR